MEGDTALVRPLFEIVKGMLEVQAKQQTVIEGMGRSFRGLLAVLAGAGEPAPPPTRSGAQDAVIAKAQAEIAELERLFSGEPEPSEGGAL